MQTIDSTIKAIGASNIAGRLGVVGGAVRNARRRGRFPAAWYVALQQLAHERGLEPVPLSMFQWRMPGSADQTVAAE